VDRFKGLVIGTIDLTRRTNVLKTGFIALSVLAGGKLIATLAGVGRALGLLKPTIGETVAALWKFAGPILIAAALYLVFDELFTLMKGGKTVIGDTLNALTGDASASTQAALYLRAGWEDVVDGFKLFAVVVTSSVIPVLLTLWHTCVAIGKVLSDVFTGNFGQISTDLKAETEEISDAFSAAGKTISDEWKKNLSTSHLADVEKMLKGGVGPLNFEALSARAGGQATGPAPYKPAFDFTKASGGTWVKPAVATSPRAASASASGAPGGGAPVIHQKNTFTTTVHTSSDQPKAVGEATGQGVSTAAQKATNNALIATRRP